MSPSWSFNRFGKTQRVEKEKTQSHRSRRNRRLCVDDIGTVNPGTHILFVHIHKITLAICIRKILNLAYKARSRVTIQIPCDRVQPCVDQHFRVVLFIGVSKPHHRECRQIVLVTREVAEARKVSNLIRKDREKVVVEKQVGQVRKVSNLRRDGRELVQTDVQNLKILEVPNLRWQCLQVVSDEIQSLETSERADLCRKRCDVVVRKPNRLKIPEVPNLRWQCLQVILDNFQMLELTEQTNLRRKRCDVVVAEPKRSQT